MRTNQGFIIKVGREFLKNMLDLLNSDSMEKSMNVVFNCCPKPSLFKRNMGITLFKGEAPAAKPAQTGVDTVEVSTKKKDAEANAKADEKAQTPQCQCKCECTGCK